VVDAAAGEAALAAHVGEAAAAGDGAVGAVEGDAALGGGGLADIGGLQPRTVVEHPQRIALDAAGAVDEVEMAGIPVAGDRAVVEDRQPAERGDADGMAGAPRHRKRMRRGGVGHDLVVEGLLRRPGDAAREQAADHDQGCERLTLGGAHGGRRYSQRLRRR
jgi:hypothetical protein